MNLRKWTLFVLLLNATVTYAQYNSIRNNKWALGDFYGLDFSDPSHPVPFPSSMDNAEGEASICDVNGNILFYTNGSIVWDKNGAVMPNGTSLAGTTSATLSTTQGALIVPVPNNADRYYVFSLTAVSNCKLYCNQVDMTLNNGLGAVDASFPLRNTVLKSNLTEKMTAVAGDNNDVWVMLHGENTDTFFAYHITATGINLTPVASKAGSFPLAAYQQGVIKFSPERSKLLSCNFRSNQPTNAGLEVFDFDVLTGIVSNPVTLDHNSYYGGTFSPDNTKVYAESTNTLNVGAVYQFDLTAITPSSSKTFLGSCGQYTDMKLGPDGKIYFGALPASQGFSNYKYLGRINYPDNAGILCGFQDSVTSLVFPHPTNSNYGRLQQGMPNDIVVPVSNPLNIKLLSFTAHSQDQDVRILWEAVEENAVSRYTVERSNNGKHYSQVFSLTSAGKEQQSSYSFTDADAFRDDVSQLYYRLKITAQNDVISYSPVRVIRKNTQNAGLVIYPNPVKDILYISAHQPADVIVRDMSGRILITQQNAQQIDVTQLPAGIYQISILDKSSGKTSKAKFIRTDS